MYSEIEGDLIEFAKEGRLDVITHGCNCMCTMGAGIAHKRHSHRNEDYIEIRW